MAIKKKTLDYEKKIWGSVSIASLSIENSYSTTLRYLLTAVSKPQGNFLDIGCAGGALTAAIKRYFPKSHVTGADFSQNSIKAARKTYPDIEFIVADVQQLPLNSKQFDFVSASHTLEHLEDPRKAVGEVYRVLKQGGIFYSVTPLEGNLYTPVGWLRKFDWFNRNRIDYLGHIQAFSKKDYLNLLTSHNFEIVSCYWSGHSYQISDLLYQPLLQLLGKPKEYLLELQSQKWQGSSKKTIYTVLRSISNILYNIEARLFFFVPGLVLHVIAVKK